MFKYSVIPAGLAIVVAASLAGCDDAKDAVKGDNVVEGTVITPIKFQGSNCTIMGWDDSLGVPKQGSKHQLPLAEEPHVYGPDVCRKEGNPTRYRVHPDNKISVTYELDYVIDTVKPLRHGGCQVTYKPGQPAPGWRPFSQTVSSDWCTKYLARQNDRPGQRASAPVQHGQTFTGSPVG
jgi:hypothetical protein